MRRLIVGILGFCLFAGFQLCPVSAVEAGERGTEKVERGAPAPDFALKTLTGETLTLEQLRGKVVVLNFWATWCPACREEMPSMERLNRIFVGSDLVLLAVNVDKKSPEAFRNFPYHFDVVLDPDGAAQKTYGVHRLPETFIIDGEGVLRERIVGAIVWDDPAAVKYFQSLVGR